MNEITIADAAYLAGLFDGEGCLAVRRHKTGCLNTTAVVCMTTPAPLYWAQRTTGVGRVYRKSQSSRGRKDVYHFVVSRGDEILHILRFIQPWLQVKNAEACALRIAILLRAVPGKRRLYPSADNSLVRISKALKSGGAAL